MAFSLVAAVLGTVTVFVSPAGDDANDGSEGRPLSSPEAACKAVRRIKAANGGCVPAGGIDVVFEDGVYRLGKMLELTAEDSGAEGAPVVWRARNRGKVSISGFVEPDWKPLSDAEALARLPKPAQRNVLESEWPEGADMESFRQSGCGLQPNECHKPFILYQGDERLIVARWPNEGYARTGMPVGTKYRVDVGRKWYLEGCFTYDSPRLERWANEKYIWANGLWFTEWADATTQITNINLTARTIQMNAYPIRSGMKEDAPFFVLNALCELDRPGEWVVDKEKRKLYAWPTAKGGRPVLGAWLHLVRMENVKYVGFFGLDFSGSRGDAIRGRSCDKISVTSCRFSKTGGWGVRIALASRCIVRGCDMEDLGEGGVELSNRAPGRWYVDGRWGSGNNNLVPDKNIVDNNRIGWFGKVISNYRPGVCVKGVGSRITHNLIYHTPHAGITHGGNDHYIGFNVLHDCCSYNDDAGSIYCCDRDWTKCGTVIEYNLVHMTGKQPRPTHTNAIYLDDQSSGKIVRGNILCRASLGVYIGGGRENLVERNIAINIPSGVYLGSRGVETMWKFIAKNGRDSKIYKKLLDYPFMYTDPLWTNRYPQLVQIAASTNGVFEHDALNNVITGNVGVACGQTVFVQNDKVVTPYTVNRDNFTFDSDPGFVDYLHLNFNAKPGSPLAKAVGSTRFDEMGLYADTYRFSPPVKFAPDVTMPRPYGVEYDVQDANVSVILPEGMLTGEVREIARDTKRCDIPGWSNGRRVEPHCGHCGFGTWKEYTMSFVPNFTAECRFELRGSKNGMTAYDDFRVEGAELDDPSFEKKSWTKAMFGKNPPKEYGCITAAPGVDAPADGSVFGAASEIYRLNSKIRIVKDRPVTIRFKFRGIE